MLLVQIYLLQNKKTKTTFTKKVEVSNIVRQLELLYTQYYLSLLEVLWLTFHCPSGPYDTRLPLTLHHLDQFISISNSQMEKG